MIMKTVKRESFNKEENGEWVLTKTWTLCYTPISFDEVDQVSEDIRKVLNPKLLSSKYKEGNETNPLFGHCYHSTQAMYIMLDGDEKDDLIPYSGTDELGNIHWWLDHDGTIIDVTAGQYDLMECDPPYDKGKPTKWYGWRNRFHKRSMGVVQDVQASKLVCTDPDGNVISIRKPLPNTL